jgi:hypothetical protein
MQCDDMHAPAQLGYRGESEGQRNGAGYDDDRDTPRAIRHSFHHMKQRNAA